jgi:hypothetical protein
MFLYLMDAVEEKLWELAMNEENFIIQEFSTAVIGIGALFFAYGEIHSLNLRLLISLIGLGSSLIVCIHSLGASKDRQAVLDILDATPLREKHKAIASWRSEGIYRLIYWSTLRIISYFSGLVAISWLLLATSNFTLIQWDFYIPFNDKEWVGFAWLLFACALLIYRKVIDNRKYHPSKILRAAETPPKSAT